MEASPGATSGRRGADEEWATRRNISVEQAALPPRAAEAPSAAGEVENVAMAVVGGGIAGLTTAIALTELGLTDFKVYERAPRVRNLSQGILGVAPNGQWALDQIHPQVVKMIFEAGVPLRNVLSKRYKAGTLETEASKPVDATGVSVNITWHRLQNILASLVPEDCIVTGRSLHSFDEDDDGVLLRFEDGSRVGCDIALACDGTFSAARRQMFPDHPPLYFGQLNWNTVLPRSLLPPGVAEATTFNRVIFHTEPHFFSYIMDAGSGDVFFQLRVRDEELAKQLSGNGGRGGLGLPGVKAKLLEVADPCEDITTVLNAIPEEMLFERCIIAHDTAPAWISPGGRVALVGDAAHAVNPMIGQGANSTFESVQAFMAALKGCAGDWKAGLATYEKSRRPMADIVQKFANTAPLNSMSPLGLFTAEEQTLLWNWVRSPPPERAELPPPLVDNLLGFSVRDCDRVSPVFV